MNLSNESVIEKVETTPVVRLGDDYATLSVKTGKYYVMNEMAAKIWGMLDKDNVGDIIEALVTRYDISEKDCLEKVQLFVLDLQENGLVKKIS